MSTRRTWALPAPADLTAVLVAFFACIVLGHQALNSDGDLPRHLRVGQEILAHGLFHADRFSWTMSGQPFVPYEWGSEVLYALAHRVAGMPGVLALMGVSLALAYFLLNRLLERLGVDPLLAFGTALAAALASSPHWLARPHVFSFPAIVALLWLLEAPTNAAAPRRPHGRLDLSPLWALLVFAVWANLHAGFLFGLALIGFYLAGDLLATWREPFRRDHLAALRRRALLLAAGIVGTCLNPSGLGIITHVASYFGKTWLVDITLEMRSPDFHRLSARIFLVLLLAVIAVLALVRRHLPWPHLVTLLGTTYFALFSGRHIELWALTGFPLVAVHADPEWRRIAGLRLSRLRLAFAAGTSAARAGVWSLAGGCLLWTVAIHGGHAAGLQLLKDRFDPTVFPVNLVRRARSADVRGRMFNDFVWGGYVLYAWPEQKVFIDGQTDFYGEPLSKLYVSIRAAQPGWDRRLDSLGVSIVLLPDEAPLSRWLMASDNWVVADSADGAVRFARTAPMLSRSSQ